MYKRKRPGLTPGACIESQLCALLERYTINDVLLLGVATEISERGYGIDFKNIPLIVNRSADDHTVVLTRSGRVRNFRLGIFEVINGDRAFRVVGNRLSAVFL